MAYVCVLYFVQQYMYYKLVVIYQLKYLASRYFLNRLNLVATYCFADLYMSSGKIKLTNMNLAGI